MKPFSLLALLCPLFFSLSSNASSAFLPTAHYPVPGSMAFSIATGDFDNDGHPDVVIVNEGSAIDNVGILINNGDGTFHNGSSYSVGVSGLTGVAVGDFNGDGNLDLAIADPEDISLDIMFGNGDGTFQNALRSSVEAFALAVGDFNQDGKLDVATVDNQSSSTLNILFGNGDGTFQTPVGYAAGTLASSITAANLNQNSFLDLMVTNNPNGGSGSPGVSVFLGRPGGKFLPAVQYAVGNSPLSVAAGDVNGDRVPDLVVANGTGAVRWMQGNGDGTFKSLGLIFTSPQLPDFVALADFNHDRCDDLVVANYGNGHRPAAINVMVGHCDGTFGTPLKLSVMNGPKALAITDVNGDNFPDILVADQCSARVCSTSNVDVLVNGR